MVKKLTPDEVDATADSLYEIGTKLREAGDLRGAFVLGIAGMRMVRNDIDQRRENRELREEAETDALTELPNRKGFYRAMQHELAESKRFKDMVIGLVYVDLDGFKQINDTFGHEKGDEILVEVAMRLQEHFRETDTVCRMGGDEMVIIMPFNHSSEFDHAEITDKVRRSLAGLYLWDDGKPKSEKDQPRVPGPYPLGASIGISTSDEKAVLDIGSPEKKMEMMSKLADQRMYQNKWRNGVYTDPDREELFHPKNARLEALRAKAAMHHEGVTINGPFDLEI